MRAEDSSNSLFPASWDDSDRDQISYSPNDFEVHEQVEDTKEGDNEAVISATVDAGALALLPDHILGLIVHFVGKSHDMTSSWRHLGRARLVCRRLAHLIALNIPAAVIHLRTSAEQAERSNVPMEAAPSSSPLTTSLLEHEIPFLSRCGSKRELASIESLTLIDNPAGEGGIKRIDAEDALATISCLSKLQNLTSFELKGNHVYSIDAESDKFSRAVLRSLAQSAPSTLMNLSLQEARMTLLPCDVYSTLESFTSLRTLSLQVQCAGQHTGLSFPPFRGLQTVAIGVEINRGDAALIELSSALSAVPETCRIQLDITLNESPPTQSMETRFTERALTVLGERVPGLVQLSMYFFPICSSIWLGLSRGFSNHPNLHTLCLHQSEPSEQSCVTSDVTKLQRLQCLHYPFFEGDYTMFFSKMPNLVSLSLMASMHTPERKEGIASAWCSPKLTSLDLSMSNSVTNAAVHDISRMSSLTHLNLMGALARSVAESPGQQQVNSLAPLCKLTKLKMLDIRNNCDVLSLSCVADLHPLTPQLTFFGLGKFARRSGTAGGEYDYKNILRASLVDVMRQEDCVFEPIERFHDEIRQLARTVPLLIAAGRHSITHTLAHLGMTIAQSLEDTSLKQDMGRVPRPMIDTEYYLPGCNGPEIISTPPQSHETHSDYYDLGPLPQ
jgi:hypothetical protein